MISVYSIIWTICNCSLMAFFLMLFRRKTSFLRKYGTSSLILLSICCTVRLILPIEFPNHQFIIHDSVIMPKIQGTYQHYLYLLTFKKYVIGIWLAGTILSVLIYLGRYLFILSIIHNNAILAEDHVNAILKSLDSECPMKVYIAPDASVPITAGIRNPNIYLPENPYDDKDLYYIILHEYSHWKRKDIRKKVLLYLLSSLMWWNPFIYLLRTEYIQLLEFNCDYTLSKHFSDRETVEYLQSMYNTQVFLEKSKKHLKTDTTAMEFIGTRRHRHSTIRQRFSLLAYGREQGHRRMKVILILLILIWMSASYYLLPQPYYAPPVDEILLLDNDNYFSEENMEIEGYSDNDYSLILNGGTEKTSFHVDNEKPDDRNSLKYVNLIKIRKKTVAFIKKLYNNIIY